MLSYFDVTTGTVVGECHTYWGLSTVGTKSWNSLLNRPREGAEEVFFRDRKSQFQEKYLL